ncbi:uncharacterized protein [Physcomitrium patens]|uniref:Uncharacterized protein n=1 Tax=Physcomitrium patens TaxID=3218 RepID=A0A7I4DK27_PHYPA|nr:uncharacterized protein LOC112280607 isoform X3 [Physcomitrium patens]|eukprot:XP_024372032.1 uncharacterized protein LOC112280607 isoform X3 [Physcomitrella patens]
MWSVGTCNSEAAGSRSVPNSPRSPGDELKIEDVTPPKSNRKGHRRSKNSEMSPFVREKTLTTPDHRSASYEGGVVNCLISFKSMERARSTLEDFCRSYFMFHNMDVHNPIHVFRYLPLLVFVESYIYQLDEQNEDQLCFSALTGDSKPSCEVSSEFASGLGKDPFAGLRVVLQEHDLLTKRIEDELMNGLHYWHLEHILCTAISAKEEVKADDVVEALRLKSFDYRVLNLLMYGLRNEPVNEAHFEFLSISELLVEMADDLYDYEADIGKNSFNVLRMFLYIFGPSEAPTMLADFIGRSEDKYQILLTELEPHLQVQYNKRCEEAVKEGVYKGSHRCEGQAKTRMPTANTLLP